MSQTQRLVRCCGVILVLTSQVACDCIGDPAGLATLLLDNQTSVSLQVAMENGSSRAFKTSAEVTDVSTTEVRAGEIVELAIGSNIADNPRPETILESLRITSVNDANAIYSQDPIDDELWDAGPLTPFPPPAVGPDCGTEYGLREWTLVLEDDDLAVD